MFWTCLLFCLNMALNCQSSHLTTLSITMLIPIHLIHLLRKFTIYFSSFHLNDISCWVGLLSWPVGMQQHAWKLWLTRKCIVSILKCVDTRHLKELALKPTLSLHSLPREGKRYPAHFTQAPWSLPLLLCCLSSVTYSYSYSYCVWGHSGAQGCKYSSMCVELVALNVLLIYCLCAVQPAVWPVLSLVTLITLSYARSHL